MIGRWPSLGAALAGAILGAAAGVGGCWSGGGCPQFWRPLPDGVYQIVEGDPEVVGAKVEVWSSGGRLDLMRITYELDGHAYQVEYR